MYNIDINFLKDRKLDLVTVKPQKTTPMEEKIPVFIGLGVTVACLAATFGALLLLNNQKANTEKEIAGLEAEITRLQGQNKQIEEYDTKIKEMRGEVQTFVSVFENIKPWSAILAEIAALAPPNLQIDSIAQGGNKVLTITGTSKSFDEVGDFVLNLKKSQFFNPENTNLTSTSFVDNPNQVKNLNQLNNSANQQAQANVAVKLPQVVNYTVTTEISDIPSSEIKNNLEARGAIGLLARLKILEQKGAIETKGVTKP